MNGFRPPDKVPEVDATSRTLNELIEFVRTHLITSVENGAVEPGPTGALLRSGKGQISQVDAGEACDARYG